MMETSLAHALRERGQRVTPQRLMVARVIGDLDRHVSAEVVFDEVSHRMPGVSLPTVYATLDLFEELGIIRRAAVVEGAALYDPRAEQHHHLVCRRCGRVEDLDAGIDFGPATRAAKRRGFASDHAELVLTGLCSDCS
jgi:Fe2+ or Zn2+ uptake regulation protein